MKIEPSADGKFSKAGEFNLVFFVYGAGDAGGGKPNVVLEYSFYQKQTEGEKYFNKTAPQVLNASTLPPQFDVAAGHQLPGSLVVPLASFPVGDYRLEIKVTDKIANKTLTRDINSGLARRSTNGPNGSTPRSRVNSSIASACAAVGRFGETSPERLSARRRALAGPRCPAPPWTP